MHYYIDVVNLPVMVQYANTTHLSHFLWLDGIIVGKKLDIFYFWEESEIEYI